MGRRRYTASAVLSVTHIYAAQRVPCLDFSKWPLLGTIQLKTIENQNFR